MDPLPGSNEAVIEVLRPLAAKPNGNRFQVRVTRELLGGRGAPASVLVKLLNASLEQLANLEWLGDLLGGSGHSPASLFRLAVAHMDDNTRALGYLTHHILGPPKEPCPDLQILQHPAYKGPVEVELTATQVAPPTPSASRLPTPQPGTAGSPLSSPAQGGGGPLSPEVLAYQRQVEAERAELARRLAAMEEAQRQAAVDKIRSEAHATVERQRQEALVREENLKREMREQQQQQQRQIEALTARLNEAPKQAPVAPPLFSEGLINGLITALSGFGTNLLAGQREAKEAAALARKADLENQLASRAAEQAATLKREELAQARALEEKRLAQESALERERLNQGAALARDAAARELEATRAQYAAEAEARREKAQEAAAARAEAAEARMAAQLQTTQEELRASQQRAMDTLAKREDPMGILDMATRASGAVLQMAATTAEMQGQPGGPAAPTTAQVVAGAVQEISKTVAEVFRSRVPQMPQMPQMQQVHQQQAALPAATQQPEPVQQQQAQPAPAAPPAAAPVPPPAPVEDPNGPSLFLRQAVEAIKKKAPVGKKGENGNPDVPGVAQILVVGASVKGDPGFKRDLARVNGDFGVLFATHLGDWLSDPANQAYAQELGAEFMRVGIGYGVIQDPAKPPPAAPLVTPPPAPSAPVNFQPVGAVPLPQAESLAPPAAQQTVNGAPGPEQIPVQIPQSTTTDRA